MLEALGLDALAEALYLAVVDHPGATEVELGRVLDVQVEHVLPIAAALEAKGLITRSLTRPPTLVPAPPKVAIELLVLQVREELERARLAAAEIERRLEQARPQDERPPGEVIEVVLGRPAIDQRQRQLQQTSRVEILFFDCPPYIGDPSPQMAAQTSAMEQGVQIRCIYDPEGLTAGSLERAHRSVAAGERARTGSVPTKLTIFDRETAMIPLLDELETALVVHPSPLLDLLLDLFERSWREATPFLAKAEGDRLTPGDRRILALLAAGHKHEAIARELGITLRSVTRHITKLHRMLGARSAFQAGAAAARRGWLQDVEDAEAAGSPFRWIPILDEFGCACRRCLRRLRSGRRAGQSPADDCPWIILHHAFVVAAGIPKRSWSWQPGGPRQRSAPTTVVPASTEGTSAA